MDESIRGQLARYWQLRATQKSLHHILMNLLPKHAVEESGKKLGIYRDGALAFGSMDETSVLLDYCIYDYRWDGQNVIERYIADT